MGDVTGLCKCILFRIEVHHVADKYNMPKLRTEVENTFGPLLSDYLSRAPLPNAQPLEGSEESHSTGLLNIVEKVYDISSGTVSHPILGQLL